MTSDANTIRERMGVCLALHGFREDCPACVSHRDGEAALDRLEADHVAAKERVAYLVAEAHGWQPRLEAAWREREAAEAERDAERGIIARLHDRVERLVAERDALQAFKDEALQTDWISRAEAAEAERDAARRVIVADHSVKAVQGGGQCHCSYCTAARTKGTS